ncbi:MAG: cadherin repeat domain-containing protein, partial [Planctomycetes bacterium]|nr:cadherin repeat domain-containing protein [Planctomycetota bacterium]
MGTVQTSSPDLKLVVDRSNQTVGLRFNTLPLPPSARIVHAYMQFQSDRPSAEVTSLTIQGEASDNASQFANARRNISSRPRTVAAVPWSPPAWTTLGAKGPDQQTPDIAPVIQEIVDRMNWVAGNSLAIIISGSGKRVAESFEGSRTGAPLLHVEYLTDNNPPVVAPATFTVAENSPNGTVVGTVAASDADPGQALKLSIAIGNNSGAFAIDAATGAITVRDAGRLDFETSPRYTLVVQATDNGPGRLSGLATVAINLTNVDEAPVVTPASFRLAKNKPNGTIVGRVIVRHADAGQTVSFSITGGNTAGAFAINSTTGEISVADPRQLDPAGTPQYALTVTATDDGPSRLAGSAAAMIDVFDPSAAAPVTFRVVGDVPYTPGDLPKLA